MKTIVISVLSILLVGLFIGSTNINKNLMAEKKLFPKPILVKDANENYQNYCAGCHGVNLDEFVDRKWVYGTNPAKIEGIIANGIELEGMPGFKASLSHDEIRALGEYILAESKSKSIKKAATKYTDGYVYGGELKYKIETLIDNIEVPWGLEFLPDGDLLIAERNGNLSVLTKNKKLIKVEGLPEIRVGGQGGLMDLQIHPKFDYNGFLYISYSYFDDTDKEKGNTAIIRGKLKDYKLVDIETIYKGTPTVNTKHHYGSKIVFDNDGYLYFSIGERGKRDEYPQKTDNSNGKIHRLFDDGRIPPDNPFVRTPGAEASIFSYGHRNPQGLAIHPLTGALWETEHGPRGGDEINIIKKGANYGWPVISFGINYNGTTFTNDTAKTGMEQPLYYYVPSIAPCGMTFVTGNKYNGWENSLLIGSLRFEYLERVELEGDKIVGHERLLEGIGRVRNVKMSPDGYIYVGVENPGRILKLLPVGD